MAFNNNVDSKGFKCLYSRINAVEYDRLGEKVRAVMGSYVDAERRTTHLDSPNVTHVIELSKDEFMNSLGLEMATDISNGGLDSEKDYVSAVAYNLIKALPEWADAEDV